MDQLIYYNRESLHCALHVATGNKHKVYFFLFPVDLNYWLLFCCHCPVLLVRGVGNRAGSERVRVMDGE